LASKFLVLVGFLRRVSHSSLYFSLLKNQWVCKTTHFNIYFSLACSSLILVFFFFFMEQIELKKERKLGRQIWILRDLSWALCGIYIWIFGFSQIFICQKLLT
jgi:hypothetical protein